MVKKIEERFSEKESLFRSGKNTFSKIIGVPLKEGKVRLEVDKVFSCQPE